MGVKRVAEDSVGAATGPEKKKKKGFSVGPANLPDGTYRRKSEECLEQQCDSMLIISSSKD